MTALTIKEQVHRIHSMHERLMAELRAIRDKCSHEDKQGKYGSDTGNWCEADDSYWIEVKCLDCGKQWHIDSKEPGYRGFKGKIIK